MIPMRLLHSQKLTNQKGKGPSSPPPNGLALCGAKSGTGGGTLPELLFIREPSTGIAPASGTGITISSSGFWKRVYSPLNRNRTSPTAPLIRQRLFSLFALFVYYWQK